MLAVGSPSPWNEDRLMEYQPFSVLWSSCWCLSNIRNFLMSFHIKLTTSSPNPWEFPGEQTAAFQMRHRTFFLYDLASPPLSLKTWQPLYLHGADAEAPVDHKLAEGCWPLVAVPAMDHEQTPQVLELSDGEISCQRCLLPFLGMTARTRIVRSFLHWKQRILCYYGVITDRISRDVCSMLGEGEHCLSISPSNVGFKQRAKNMRRIPIWTLASNSEQPLDCDSQHTC